MRARTLVGGAMTLALLTATMVGGTAAGANHRAGSGGGRTCHGHKATITGTSRDDSGRHTLVGTRHSDVIVGARGNDLILARDGADIVCAGPGKDQVKGANGNDRVYGQGGDDLLLGGNGMD